MITKLFTPLFALFFAICIGVHIYGILYKTLPESNLSHAIHMVSYGLLLYWVIARVQKPWYWFVASPVYPFGYHAQCLVQHFQAGNGLSAVCLLVVLMIPAAGLIKLQKSEQRATNADQQS